MRKKTIIFLWAVSLIAWWLTLPAEAINFVVSPPRFEFTMTPGASTTEGVEITNLEDSPLELRAYLSDWELGAQGELVYKRVAALNTSCSTWVRVNPQNVTLGPRESRLVRFTITAPAGTAGSYWTVLFFESKPTPAPKGRMGVLLAGRVGVIIYSTIAGTEQRAGKILGLKVIKDRENKYNFAVTFENTGNIHYRPKGSWELKDETGKKVRKGEIEEYLVLPKTQRTKEFPMSVPEGAETSLGPGKYTFSVTLDYGAKDLVGGDLIFEVPGAKP